MYWLYILIITIVIFIILYIFFIDYRIGFKNVKNNIVDVYSKGHLGDHIYIIYYFNSIKSYLENNGILINYYIFEEYHNQVKEFIQLKNITILNYKIKGLNVHNININYTYNYFYFAVENIIKKRKRIDFIVMYINYFNETSKKLKFNIKLEDFPINNDERLLIEYDRLNDKYKNIDILIINSIPRSGQYNLQINKWNKYIKKLNKYFKIVTTYKIGNILCTLDDNLSVFKIGALSIHSKVAIAINTGPTASLFNKYTLNNIKKIYLFDYFVTFGFTKIKHLNDINLITIDELKLLINL
jgi:hypothetical protein